MKNILIFPCGSEIGLEIHRALKYNKHFKLIGGSSVEDHGKFVYENYIGGIPFINDENFVERVNELVLNNHIDAIYPTMDSVIVKLMQNKDFIGADIISSELETVEICLSKNKTYKKLASDIKLPLLYDSISSTSEYPVFIKPDVGYGSIGAKKIDDYEQAKQHLRENDKAIISEYLPGEEYSIDCFTDRNGNLLFVGPRIRRRIRNGISVNTITIDDQKGEFKNIAEIINSVIDLKGAWFFQMKRDKNEELTLLEIAARIGGSSGIFRPRGINFPELTLWDHFNYDVEIIDNGFQVEMDRAFDCVYKIPVEL